MKIRLFGIREAISGLPVKKRFNEENGARNSYLAVR